jgi:MarR family transcriptional regulator, temperature-dependent positive regulator of motility
MAKFRRYCTTAVNKQLSVVGSSLHEFAILLRLSEDDEAPQSELAYDAAIDPAAVSRLVRDLTRAGLVTTRVDPTDKRQRFVKLTSKGQTLVRTLSPIVDNVLTPYMSGLSAPEEQEFLRLLRKAHDCAARIAGEGEDVREPALEARPSRAEASARPRRKRAS